MVSGGRGYCCCAECLSGKPVSPPSGITCRDRSGLFLRIRGVQTLNAQYRLPTCPKVFNIYHPYDPVSFRIEPLIEPSMAKVRPVLVPHHKGRKRMHLGRSPQQFVSDNCGDCSQLLIPCCNAV